MKRFFLLIFLYALPYQSFATRTGAAGAKTFADPDYTITTTGGLVTITDVAGAADVLDLSENGGNLRISVVGKTYSLDGGAITAFTTPADIPLAGKTGITVNAGAGDDVLDIRSFSSSLPALTINGDAGNDAVNFLGNINFAADASLDLDLLNDGPTPGIDRVNFDAPVILSGSGAVTIKVSRSIYCNTGGRLQSENGNITMEANYQPIPNTEIYPGMKFENFILEITGTGLLTMKGKGGVNAPNADGISVNNSQIIGGTTGTVYIEGRGANLPTTYTARGILMFGTSMKVTSHGADLTMVGYGGTGGGTNNPVGINIGQGSITAAGNANIFLTGYGGSAIGVSVGINFSQCTVETAGGNITITGTSPGFGASFNSNGIVKTIGNGDIIVNGTATSNGIEDPYYGISQSFRHTFSTVDGDIILTGISPDDKDDISLYDASDSPGYDSNFDSENGNIVFVANSFTGGSSKLNATNGSVIFSPRSANRPVLIGGADVLGPNGSLGISDEELDNITAATIEIGNASTGAVSVVGPISRPSGGNVAITGNELILNTTSIDLNGGNLLINTTENTRYSGTPLNIAAGNVSFATGNTLLISISGTATNDQLNVAGAVNLTGVTLELSGNYTPTVGHTFTIVLNDGSDPIVGNFEGLAEGDRIADFLGSDLEGIISYVGGDGNDVVITVSYPLPVTLVSFSGRKIAENKNLLSWITSDEKDFDRFEIQYAANARSFETIGVVNAATTGSTALKYYEFADNQAKVDSYYRLKMIDTDGTFKFSKIISITGFGSEQDVVGPFYPNPSRAQVFVDVYAVEEGSWKITMSNASGKIIRSEVRMLEKGVNKISLDRLPAGLNLVRFENGQSSMVRKLVR